MCILQKYTQKYMYEVMRMIKPTTVQSLAAGFKELVLTTPIDKITIKDITDKAGVIRPTFYNHFQDKYELLEWIIKEEIINPVIPLFQSGFIKEGLILIFTNMQKEKEFYIQASKLEGQNSFSSISQSLIENILVHYIHMKVGEHAYFHNWMSSEIIAEYYAGSICFLITKWIQYTMNVPPMEMAVLCEKVFESNLDEIISEMK